MYGLLIESIVDFIKKRYGSSVWEKVRKRAKIENYTFSTHQQYSETMFLKTIKCLAEITNNDQNEIMEELGIEFVNFVSQYGYDRILRVLGRHMRDFLNGLDNLHEYMRFSYPKLKPPSFFVEKENSRGLILHYRSKRKGYMYYVKGQIKQVGKIFYNLDVNIEVMSQSESNDLAHVVFNLAFKNEQYKYANSNASFSNLSTLHRNLPSNLPIKSEIFFELFPFHVVFNRKMEIISIGHGLNQALKNIEGESVKDSFNLVRPLIPFTWDDIISHTNNVFELTTIEPVKRSSSPLNFQDRETNIYATQSSIDSGFDECLKLKGQMMYVKEWDAIIFLATPVLENLDVMFNTGFYINDLSMHDSSRDLVLVGTQQSAELKLALDQEKQKSKALEESMKKLDVEMKRTDQLLYQMIPKKIADRLRSGEPVMNLCEVVPSCTILFSDVVGFTSTCSLLTPMEVVSMLNGMYTLFDKSLEVHSVYKVETIGDAYMVVSGLPERNNNHAEEIMEMGFDMLNNISTLENPATQEPMRIRVGCHSGPVVAGVVGLKMPRYCLFGDTVNTASRMESSSEPMKIHISHTTKQLLETKPYKIVERGKLEIKGKGEMKTYFVLSKLDEDGRSIKCPFMEVFEQYKLHKAELEAQKLETEMARENLNTLSHIIDSKPSDQQDPYDDDNVNGHEEADTFADQKVPIRKEESREKIEKKTSFQQQYNNNNNNKTNSNNNNNNETATKSAFKLVNRGKSVTSGGDEDSIKSINSKSDLLKSESMSKKLNLAQNERYANSTNTTTTSTTNRNNSSLTKINESKSDTNTNNNTNNKISNFSNTNQTTATSTNNGILPSTNINKNINNNISNNNNNNNNNNNLKMNSSNQTTYKYNRMSTEENRVDVSNHNSDSSAIVTTATTISSNQPSSNPASTNNVNKKSKQVKKQSIFKSITCEIL